MTRRTLADVEKLRRELVERFDKANPVLGPMLELAVMMWTPQVQAYSPAEAATRARTCSDFVAAHGDDLMYGGKHCAEAFNRFAEGVTLASFVPGGITFAGRHWENTPTYLQNLAVEMIRERRIVEDVLPEGL